MPQEDQYIRSVAGLTLKNNIRTHYPAIPPEVMDYIKECCLQHVGDADVGKAVSLVIASVVARGQIQNWPQVLQVLLDKLDDSNPAMVNVSYILSLFFIYFRCMYFFFLYIYIACSRTRLARFKRSVKIALMSSIVPLGVLNLWSL
jgi:hypothetical protein